MKKLSLVLSLVAMICASSLTASADWGGGNRGPGWRGGNGPGWNNGGDRGPGHGGPGWDHGGDHGGPGPGGPGWGPQPRQMYVTCESNQYGFNSCYVPGYIQGAQLVRQESSASCNLGQSWGYQNNSIWVNGGCRGTFLVYMR